MPNNLTVKGLDSETSFQDSIVEKNESSLRKLLNNKSKSERVLIPNLDSKQKLEENKKGAAPVKPPKV